MSRAVRILLSSCARRSSSSADGQLFVSGSSKRDRPSGKYGVGKKFGALLRQIVTQETRMQCIVLR